MNAVNVWDRQMPPAPVDLEWKAHPPDAPSVITVRRIAPQPQKIPVHAMASAIPFAILIEDDDMERPPLLPQFWIVFQKRVEGVIHYCAPAPAPSTAAASMVLERRARGGLPSAAGGSTAVTFH